jgi:hypothetical protein
LNHADSGYRTLDQLRRSGARGRGGEPMPIPIAVRGGLSGSRSVSRNSDGDLLGRALSRLGVCGSERLREVSTRSQPSAASISAQATPVPLEAPL